MSDHEADDSVSWAGGHGKEWTGKKEFFMFGAIAQKAFSGGYLESIRMKGTGHRGRGRFQAYGAQDFQKTFGNGCE